MINFQGSLTDPSDGTPLTGSYLMEFYLYDTQTGGTSMWSEQQDVTVVNGIFNVKIGSADPATNPLEPDYFNNTTPYLEIKIYNSGWETLTPRQQLTSTPFAMKAALADNVVNNSVVTDSIAAGAVTREKIFADAVGGDELAADAVGASEIANNAVGTGEIVDNAVTAAKIIPNIVSSVDGVTNDGGNIDLVPGSNITITPNNSANTITISADTPSEYLTQNEGDSRYINKSGDRMSGSLYVDGPNGLFVGTDNGSNDDKIKMDSGSEYLMWDEDPNRFYLSDDLYLSGLLTVGGVYASQLAYNSIGYVGAGEPSTDITDFRDLFVDDSIEAGDSVYAQNFKYSAPNPTFCELLPNTSVKPVLVLKENIQYRNYS